MEALRPLPQDEEEDVSRSPYRPFHPQSFDEDAAGPAARPVAENAEFTPQYEEDGTGGATFTERAAEPATTETDFASLRFQRENTLLTNAESYATSVREEAQLYVRQLRGEVEELNRQAEARYAEAERIKAEAQAEAERRIADAVAQSEQVRTQAQKEGFEAGHGEGIQRRYEEAAPHLAQLESVLEEIGEFRRKVAYYTEKDGVRLALLIAKKMLRSELKTNKPAIAKLVASTLSMLQGKGTFRVWVSPADHEFMLAARPSLERFLDEEQSLTLRAKPELTPGNVLIESDREVIDLTFQSQFYHLEQQFMQTLAEHESTQTAPQPRRPRSEPAKAAQPAAKAPAAGARDDA